MDWPNKIRLGEVAEYYNVIIGTVISDIFEYGRPGYVINNYTIVYVIKVNPERHKFDFIFTINLSSYLEEIINNGINNISEYY